MNGRVIEYCPRNPLGELMCKIQTCPCCDTLGVVAVCPHCDGAGRFATRTLREAQLTHVDQFEQCMTCNGHGCLPISLELFSRLGFAEDAASKKLVLRKPVRSAVG
jgi:hypothetical protein